MTRLQTLILVLLGVTLLLGQPLQAGGIMVAPATAATPPMILQERAVIAWDGKTESLLIEPSLDAQGQSFGWIVPLPKVPELVEMGTPDILNTLDFICQPEIIKSCQEARIRSDLDPFALIAFLVLFIFIVKMIWTNRGLTEMDWVVLIVGAFLSLAMVSGISKPADRSPPFIVGPEISVRMHEVVGNYEIAVMECQKAQELDAWLETHGFAKLPPAGRPIVEDYIKNGWCFVASKLQLDGEGLRRPHPLFFKFPAARPIYPMRLTAMVSLPIYLRLLVIAPRRMEIPLLRTDYVSQVNDLFYYSDRDQRIPPLALLPWLGNENDVVSAAGEWVKPADMVTDLVFGTSSENDYYRRCFLTPASFFEQSSLAAFSLFLLGSMLILLLSPIYGSRLFGRRQERRRFVLGSLGLLTLLLVVMIFIVARDIPVIYNAHQVSGNKDGVKLLSNISGELKKEFSTSLPVTKAEVCQRVWEKIKADRPSFPPLNPYTGTSLREEASPGNFTVEMTTNGPVLYFYGLRSHAGLWIESWPLVDSARETKSNPTTPNQPDSGPAVSGIKQDKVSRSEQPGPNGRDTAAKP
jgi:hypothetical protein